MFKTLKRTRSFTLLEIIIVVILASTLAAMALVSYKKTINQAYMDEAFREMTLVHGAQQVYKAKHGTYWPSNFTSTDVNEINNVLGLSLVPGMFNFALTGNGTAFNFAMTYKNPPYFYVMVTEQPISSTNPMCLSYCP